MVAVRVFLACALLCVFAAGLCVFFDARGVADVLVAAGFVFGGLSSGVWLVRAPTVEDGW